MNNYKNLIDIHSFDSWFATPLKFFKICPSVESALVLSYLINEIRRILTKNDRSEAKKLTNNDYWNACSSSSLQKTFDISTRVQTRAIKELKEVGLIEIKYKGIPKRRLIRIDIHEVFDREIPTNNEENIPDVKEENPTSGEGANTPDSCNETGIQVATFRSDSPLRNVATNVGTCKVDNGYSKEHPVAPAEQRRVIPGFFHKNISDGNSSERFEDCCVNKLLTTLSSANKVRRRPKITKWKSAFRDLVSKDEVPESEVTKVLDWYCDNIGGEYVPVALDGLAFRNKFDSIVLAMERDSGSAESEYVPTKEQEEEWQYQSEVFKAHRKSIGWEPPPGVDEDTDDGTPCLD